MLHRARRLIRYVGYGRLSETSDKTPWLQWLTHPIQRKQPQCEFAIKKSQSEPGYMSHAHLEIIRNSIEKFATWFASHFFRIIYIIGTDPLVNVYRLHNFGNSPLLVGEIRYFSGHLQLQTVSHCHFGYLPLNRPLETHYFNGQQINSKLWNMAIYRLFSHSNLHSQGIFQTAMWLITRGFIH